MKIKKKYIFLSLLSLFALLLYGYFPSKAARDLIAPPAINGKVSKIVWEKESGGVFFDGKGKLYRVSDGGRAITQYKESGEFDRKIYLKFKNPGWRVAGLSIAEKEDRFQMNIEIRQYTDKYGYVRSITRKYEVDLDGNVIRELASNDQLYNKNLSVYGCVFCEREDDPPSPADCYDANRKRITVPYLSGLYPDGQGHYITQFFKGRLLRFHSFGYPIYAKYFEKYPDEDKLYTYVIPVLAMFLDLPKWIKKPPSYADGFYGFGFDNAGNFYAITYRNGTIRDRYIVRINPAGSITGVIKIPDNLYVPHFLADMSEKEMLAKGYSLNSTVGYRLTCDGNIYAYNNWRNRPYSDKAYKRWIQHGENFMYRFQFDHK